MRQRSAGISVVTMATVLGARLALAQPAPVVAGPAAPSASFASPASSAPSAPSAPSASSASSAPFSVTIPLPPPSATVAAPAASAPPRLLLVAPPGSTPGQAPPGYMVLVPWTPPAATPVETAPVRVPEARTTSYAWKLIFPDVAALSLSLAAIPTQSWKSLEAGLLMYALGAPIVHIAQGQPGRGVASLGLRTLAPIAALSTVVIFCLGDDPDGSSHSDTCPDLVVGSLLVGVVGALVTDYVFLAREPQTSVTVKTMRWSPTLLPSKQGMSLGVVGAW